MSQLFKLCALGLVLSAALANADTKGVTFSGSVEAGYADSWKGVTGAPAITDNGFLVDSAIVKMDAALSDKTHFVFTNAASMNSDPAPASLQKAGFAANFNSANYFSDMTVAGGSNGQYLISNLDAYIDHKWAEGVHTWIGHMETPWGMESMVSRVDMPTYYYSAAYSRTAMYGSGNPAVFAAGLGWTYDTGIKLALTDIIPGTFELGVFDGTNGSPNYLSPAVSARWSIEMKKGDMSLTPVVSAYTGHYAGGPKDLGLSGGAMWKMGAVFANAEFVFTQSTIFPVTNPAVHSTLWSIYVEPGVDLGVVTVSLKADYDNDSNNGDFNIGAALGHDYGDFNVKLAYEHQGFGSNSIAGDFGPNVNDLRVLFGVKF